MSDTNWFMHELSCPLCAGPVTLVSTSAPDPYKSQFVVTCDDCKRDMVIRVNLVVLYHPADDHRTEAHRTKDRIRKARERERQAQLA